MSFSKWIKKQHFSKCQNIFTYAKCTYLGSWHSLTGAGSLLLSGRKLKNSLRLSKASMSFSKAQCATPVTKKKNKIQIQKINYNTILKIPLMTKCATKINLKHETRFLLTNFESKLLQRFFNCSKKFWICFLEFQPNDICQNLEGTGWML